jgi:hypothetical protein
MMDALTMVSLSNPGNRFDDVTRERVRTSAAPVTEQELEGLLFIRPHKSPYHADAAMIVLICTASPHGHRS